MSPRRTRKHGLGGFLVGIVAFMQAAVVVAFLVDPWDPPKHHSWWQAFWALFHQEAFVPLVVVMIAAPPITWLAWSQKGPHRKWLVVSWAVFVAVIAVCFAHRAWVMTRLFWEYSL